MNKNQWKIYSNSNTFIFISRRQDNGIVSNYLWEMPQIKEKVFLKKQFKARRRVQNKKLAQESQ